MGYTVLIGGYNGSRIGGILEVRISEKGEVLSTAGINGPENPTFFEYHAPTRRIFSVSAQSSGAALCMLSYDGARTALQGLAPFCGRGICHIGISPDARLAGAACFASADVTLFACGGEGFLREVFHKSYASPDVIAHPHCMRCAPDGRHFYLVDLGRDCIECIDCTRDTPAECGTLRLREGDGPRQILFAPDGRTAWVVTEYSNVVYTLARDPDSGALTILGRVPTLAEEYGGISYGASIACSARRGLLYASNRGADSIAVFRVREDGTLARLRVVPSGGFWPRHIALTHDDAFLLCCNERSDALCVLPLDADGIPGAPAGGTGHPRCAFALDIT